MPAKAKKAASVSQLAKSPTGIRGLDEITGGGLPKGRTTLVCGNAGCGKTLLGMEFLVKGALLYNEPGVCMAFEERPEDLAMNVASLGFDVAALIAKKKLNIDFVEVERSQIDETGEYDLEGLFVRLAYAIDSIGAKRVLLDTVEVLFAGLNNPAIVRAELRRLFRWLDDKGVTAIVTGERTGHELTRQGLEEYVSDCVLLLDHRVDDSIFTRRLRVVKYRGSTHGTNEYPFLIDTRGLSIFPLSSLTLDYPVSNERISTGTPVLDRMLGGEGYFRGSSILASGTAGTGKTTLGAHFASAACARGEKCVFFAFEESASQLTRNMQSVGIDLRLFFRKNLLQVVAVRPTNFGLETHLVEMYRAVDEFQPKVVVIDPISSLVSAGSRVDAVAMVLRLIDFFKQAGITALMTSLSSSQNIADSKELTISSLVDTWVLLRDTEMSGERNRSIFVLKSRGMRHSNQVQEFLLTEKGFQIVEAYLGGNGGLSGTSRLAQENREKGERLRISQEIERKRRELDRKRQLLKAQIAGLRLELEGDEEDLSLLLEQERVRLRQSDVERSAMAKSRFATPPASKNEVRSRTSGSKHE